MGKTKCLVVGSGGREASIVDKLKVEDCIVFAYINHENPGIIDVVNATGGKFFLGNELDGKQIAQFATQNNIELAIVSNDSSLEAGVVDELKKANILVFGPTRQGAKVEWSKVYALDLVERIAPQMNIKTYKVTSKEELDKAIDKYTNCEFVVKPDGLTAGKGVKVGKVHFKSKEEGYNYANKCLEESGKVIIQDIMQGYEFTVMGFTDGKDLVLTPITVDYSYRYDDDKGPGTGGMGCFTYEDGSLPFLDQNDVQACRELMQNLIKEVNKDNIEFTGVLYGGFFKTSSGIKVIEFNARFGDPECINIMGLLDSNFIDIAKACANGMLSEEICRFKENTASMLVYLVSKNYALGIPQDTFRFSIDQENIEKSGGRVIYSSCIKEGSDLIPTGVSRLAAITKVGPSLKGIRKEVYELINRSVKGPVEYRADIGKTEK